MLFSNEINFNEVLKKISEQFQTQISLTCSALYLADAEIGWKKAASYQNEASIGSALDPKLLYTEFNSEELREIASNQKPITAPYSHKSTELDESLHSALSSFFSLSAPLIDFEGCQGILTFWCQPEAQFFEDGGGEEYLLLMADEALGALKQRQRLVIHMHKYAEEEQMETEENTDALAASTAEDATEPPAESSPEAVSAEYQSSFLSTDLADRIEDIDDADEFSESVAHTIDFSSGEEESLQEIQDRPDFSKQEDISADQLASSDLFDVDEDTAVESELVEKEQEEEPAETTQEQAEELADEEPAAAEPEEIAEPEQEEDENAFGDLWEEDSLSTEPKAPTEESESLPEEIAEETMPAMAENFENIQEMDAPVADTVEETTEMVTEEAEEETLTEETTASEEDAGEAETNDLHEALLQEFTEEGTEEPEETQEPTEVALTDSETPLPEPEELSQTSFVGFTEGAIAEETTEAEEVAETTEEETEEESPFAEPPEEITTPDPELEEEVKLEIEGELEAEAELVAVAELDITEEHAEEEAETETALVEQAPSDLTPAATPEPIAASAAASCLQIILQNSGQGYLAFDKNGKVSPLYGQMKHPYLGNLAAGDDALEPLFYRWNASNRESASYQNERDLELIRDLMQSVFMRITDLEVLTEMFPSELEKNGTVLKLEYHYMESPEGMDNDVIFIVFKDVTEERILQRKIQAEASHSNMLIKVALDLEGYSNFHKEFHLSISHMLEELEKPAGEIDLAMIKHFTINIGSGAEIYELAEIASQAPRLEVGLDRFLENRESFKSSAKDMLAMSVLELQELMDDLHQKYLEPLVSAKKLKDLNLFQVSGDKIQNFESSLVETLEAQFLLLEKVFEKNYLPFTKLPQLEEITKQRLESVKHIIWQAAFEKSKQKIHSQTMGLKKQPISLIFNKYQSIAENLGKRLDKQLEIHTQGSEIEVPANQLQDLFSSIIHLIRNSVGHGIEKMEERVFLGKSLEGELNFTAKQEGEALTLSFQDDGRGMSQDQIYQAALKYQTEEELAGLSPEEITQLFLSAGASSGSASKASGLGLQTVYQEVQKLNGSFTLETEDEKGSTFMVTIPNILNT